MPAPVEPHFDRRRFLRFFALGLAVLAFAVAFAYTALHPVRLMTQARLVGNAPAALLPGYEPPGSCRWCETGKPGSSVEDAGEGYPFETTLPDGRRVALVLKNLLWAANNYEVRDLADHPGANGGILYLVSPNAPDQKSPQVGDLPKGIDSLIGVTDDHRVFGASLGADKVVSAPLPSPSPSIKPTPTPVPKESQPSDIELMQRGILDNTLPMTTFYVRAPRSNWPNLIAVSPQGDRLLWVFPFTRTPYAPVVWAAHYIPKLQPYAQPCEAVAVWMTGLHGENPVRIGEETVVIDMASHEETSRAASMGKRSDKKAVVFPSHVLPTHFSWRPDGRAIRFVWGAQVFEVAVAGK